MSTRVDIPAITPWSLAARLAAAPAANPWAVLVVAAGLVESESEELCDELVSLLDTPVERVHVSSPHELLESVEKHGQATLVLVGLDALDPGAWRRIDTNRRRLARELPAVVVLEEASAPTMLEHAPNLWSWLSGSVWRSTPEEGLTAEQRAQRLDALREHYGFDDAELVRRAEAGKLPPEPDIAEWLVLIGRGHLIEG